MPITAETEPSSCFVVASQCSDESLIHSCIQCLIWYKFAIQMTRQSTDDIVMPGKFLSLILHLLVVTMAYFSYVPLP